MKRAARLFAVVLSLAAIAGAQAQVAPLTPGPYEEKLDALLAARDYGAVTKAAYNEVSDAATASRALNWLRAEETARGRGSFVSFLYAASLWRVAGSIPANQAVRLKASAATQLLFTRLLIRTDGYQCADAGSPPSRLAFIEGQLAETARYFDQLPAKDRADVERDARVLLILSYPRREDDDWLCRSGPLYIAKYLKKHPDGAGEKVTSETLAARNVMVPNDPEIEADFLPFENWEPKSVQEIKKINRETGGPAIPPSLFEKRNHP